MPAIDTSIEFEVYCDECGSGICHTVSVRTSRNRSMPQLITTPCETCIEAAKEEGKQEGLAEGEATNKKYNDGYSEGYADALAEREKEPA